MAAPIPCTSRSQATGTKCTRAPYRHARKMRLHQSFCLRGQIISQCYILYVHIPGVTRNLRVCTPIPQLTAPMDGRGSLVFRLTRRKIRAKGERSVGRGRLSRSRGSDSWQREAVAVSAIQSHAPRFSRTSARLGACENRFEMQTASPDPPTGMGERSRRKPLTHDLTGPVSRRTRRLRGSSKCMSSSMTWLSSTSPS